MIVARTAFAQADSTNHLEVLRQSTMFSLAGGLANVARPEAWAVAAICRQSNAADTFQALLKEPGVTQQLYGLLGLRVLGSAEFESSLPALLESKANVTVLRGCIAGNREAAEVAREIKASRYTVRTMPVPNGKYAPVVIE